MNEKSKWFALVVFLLLGAQADAQITGIGIQPKYNLSRQLNIDPDLEFKFAVSTQDYIFTSGFDAFVDFALGEKWGLRGKIGHETKGFYGQMSESNPGFYVVDEHKFKYISTDFNLIRKWGASEKIQIYNFLGFTSGYLIARESDLYPVWLPPQPVGESDWDGYSKFNLGLLGGVGVSLRNICWFELEYNQDVLAPLNNSNLKVRNTVFSANLGINLLQLFKTE